MLVLIERCLNKELHGRGPVPPPLPNPWVLSSMWMLYWTIFPVASSSRIILCYNANMVKEPFKEFKALSNTPDPTQSSVVLETSTQREPSVHLIDLRSLSSVSVCWRSPGANLEPSAESWEPQEKTLTSPIKGLWYWLWRGPRLYQIKILGPRRRTDGQTTTTLRLKLMGKILKVRRLHLTRYWHGTNKAPSYSDQNDTRSHGIKLQLRKIDC